jgi:hypothetical protein
MRVLPHNYETALHPRLVQWREGWAALVRDLKATPRRWAALLALTAVAAVTAGVQAASMPVAGMITAAGILAVLGIERFVLGAPAARRRTRLCEEWVQDERRMMRRARIRGSLLIVSGIQSLIALWLHRAATLQNRCCDAMSRLRRGALAVTLLPRFDSRSLRASRA